MDVQFRMTGKRGLGPVVKKPPGGRVDDAVPLRAVLHAKPAVGTRRGAGLYLLFAVLLSCSYDRPGSGEGVSALASTGAGEVWRGAA